MGELQGTVVKVLKEDDQGKVCSECPDDFKDQPIEGLTFMWGLEKDGEGEWKSGHILDPQSGKIYKSKLNVADDGESLEVRGYIGVSNTQPLKINKRKKKNKKVKKIKKL